MLKQRILTAFLLIPIMLLILIYLPPASFKYLTAFIAIGAAWEWSLLMGLKESRKRYLYLVLISVAFIASTFIATLFVLFVACIFWLFAISLLLFYPHGAKWWRGSILLRGIMGLMVLVPCWLSINFIRQQSDGLMALIFLFVLVFGADSAAYFTGKKWGTTKLAPKISPGKSWQGLIGALLFSFLMAISTLWFLNTPIDLWPWAIVLSITTVLFSIVGDLFESMLKREVGVKDSGKLLPGHGGLLDRIDSLTAAAPIFAMGAWLIGMYVH